MGPGFILVYHCTVKGQFNKEPGFYYAGVALQSDGTILHGTWFYACVALQSERSNLHGTWIYACVALQNEGTIQHGTWFDNWCSIKELSDNSTWDLVLYWCTIVQ